MPTDPKVGDRVADAHGSGMVGTVSNWWRDDQGVWVEVDWDGSAGLLGADFHPEGPTTEADDG